MHHKPANIVALYTPEQWYWMCPRCEDLGGPADPEDMPETLQCGRCHTHYGQVLDYPLKSRPRLRPPTELHYRYEYLPHLLFDRPLVEADLVREFL